MNCNKIILSRFNRIKHDYFDKAVYQFTLDYFLSLESSFTGSTTSLKAPPTASNRQYKESPADRPNCCINHAGTVVLSDVELVEAKDNEVFVPSTIESPSKDMGDIVFKITYPVGKSLIYYDAHIGIGNRQNKGMRCIEMTVQNPRQLRGLAILSSGMEAIKRIDKWNYQVKSQHGDFYYDVVYKYGIGWTCSCPNWKEYQDTCKHIYAVDYSQQLRLEVEREIDLNNTLEAPDTIKCPSCDSDKVVKNGQRKTQKGINQRFLCRDCGHRFVNDRELSRLKATPEVISVSMDLYFKGNSLAKIKHHLEMFYDTKVARNTILSWIHKFSMILNEYAERHKPNVGGLWNSDEMTVNIRKDGEKNNFEWIWNLMDSETRYLLASRITESRYVTDARKPLRDAKTRAGKKPKALITDGQHSYRDAVKKEFGTRTNPTIHYRTKSNRKQFLNQNIERLNGTERERLKVMRGLGSEETAQNILDGQRFYYNNIRPHMSLDGLTPGQVAGLPFVPIDENPWLTYIKMALDEKDNS